MTTRDALSLSGAQSATELELVVTAGAAATVGSVLVFLGVTDLVSLVYGYRPVETALVVLYGRAFLAALAGWSSLCWALLRVGRGILARP
ncbi:MAG: hypothetical protein ABEJ42_06185 [Halobacteriaceae archaeon]